ncbi:heparinase II/III family protein [Streptomyces sp. NPDC049954]|uniref:heparinase II/III domain-containing protein n=1 Tax=Streptomyces sp. NPDC049954 TaxID=3155779 RepID=UPI00343CC376
MNDQDPALPRYPEQVSLFDPLAARLPRPNPYDVRMMLERAPADWHPFPAVDDRSAWGAIGAGLGADRERLVEDGRRLAERGLLPMPVQAWRDMLLKGEPAPYVDLWMERRSDLAKLLVAHLLEPGEHTRDAIIDLVWATCEETSWAQPEYDPPSEFPDSEDHIVDLWSSITAVGLAELCAVLRPVLPRPVIARVEREIDRRVITPYLSKDTWWWMYEGAKRASNWDAVCNWGVVGAALYVESDTARLASILCKSARSLEDYLENFDPEGGTSEGTGYWNFGFGSYCQLADLVERRTGGALNWFDAPIVERVAAYPLRSRLTVNSWPTFSDATPDPSFNTTLLLDLGRRLGMADLVTLASTRAAGDYWLIGNSPVTQALRTTCAGRLAKDGPMPPLRGSSQYFRGVQWLLSQADPEDEDTLALAVKGGHNLELHNQNDLGSVIVRAGGEDLVVDPGRGRYTRDYFSPDHRYSFFVNRSFGHSVPCPGGIEQGEGNEYRAAVRELRQSEESDRIVLDLTAAYPPKAALHRLERTAELRRKDARVVLTDDFSFSTPQQAESAIVTHAEVILVEEGRLLLRGEKATLAVSFDPQLVTEVHTQDALDLFDGPRDAFRVAFRTREAVSTTTITLVMTRSDEDVPRKQHSRPPLPASR